MKSASADTLNKRWKDDKSAFGYRMLMKMGWKEDKGLGKNETGSVSHLKVTKREEGLGLGMEKTTDGAGALGWNATALSFNAVLNTLKEAYGPSSTNNNNNNNNADGESSSSDKKRKKSSKKQKKEKSEKKKDKKPIPIISLGMKYKKMSRAKDLSCKTQEELRAVLGAAASNYSTVSSDKVPQVTIQKKTKEGDSDEEKSRPKKKSKKSKQ